MHIFALVELKDKHGERNVQERCRLEVHFLPSFLPSSLPPSLWLLTSRSSAAVATLLIHHWSGGFPLLWSLHHGTRGEGRGDVVGRACLLYAFTSYKEQRGGRERERESREEERKENRCLLLLLLLLLLHPRSRPWPWPSPPPRPPPLSFLLPLVGRREGLTD